MLGQAGFTACRYESSQNAGQAPLPFVQRIRASK
jgi:hypothetical protein